MDKPLRDMIYFPIAYNVVGIVIIGFLYIASPEHIVEPMTLNTWLYSGVVVTHLSIFMIVFKRLGISGLRELFLPRGKIRWLPSMLVFTALNAIFTAYMMLALNYGRISPWGDYNVYHIFFFLVVNPITAGFVEEMTWRGYFIKKQLTMGYTEWKSIIYSSISFAFIHGFFVWDKLIVTFIFGVIGGMYYVRERNLPVLIFTHVVVDVIAFGLSVFR